MLAANRRQAQIGIVSRGASHLAPLYLICRGPRVYTGFPIGASDGGPFCPLPAPCSRPLPSCGAVSPITVPLFFISKIPVSTPNEGVWDWVVVGKLGLQLLQVHCQSKTGGPPEVGAVQRAVQPLLWLLAKTHQL